MEMKAAFPWPIDSKRVKARLSTECYGDFSTNNPGGRDFEFVLRCWHLTSTQGLGVGPTRYFLDGVHEPFQHFALH